MLLVWAPETFHRRRATWGTSKTCCRLAVSAWGSSRRSWTLASAQLQACSLSPMEAFSLLWRIMSMMRHSSENASIGDKLHAWSCALAKVQDLRELPHALTASLQHVFEVPQVALRLWNVSGAQTSSIYTMGVSEDAKS